jgi:two-component system, NarL family, nitrate/nitrite response regulator NarL
MSVASPSASRRGAQQPRSASASSSHSRERLRPIPTLIVDKSPVFRAGLAHILAASRFRITTSCSSLSELSEKVLGDRPCVLLISLYEEVPAVMRQLASLSERGLHVIVLTERFHPEELVAAFTAGLAGYLLKDEVSPDVLVKGMELALRGGVPISKGLTDAPKDWPLQAETVSTVQVPETGLAREQPRAASDAMQKDGVHQPSKREQTILDLLTQGASNKNIARQLNITEATVKAHMKSLLRKLGVSNRTQAALWAMAVRANDQSKPQPPISSSTAGNPDRISETIPKDEAYPGREGLRNLPVLVEIDFKNGFA